MGRRAHKSDKGGPKMSMGRMAYLEIDYWIYSFVAFDVIVGVWFKKIEWANII